MKQTSIPIRFFISLSLISLVFNSSSCFGNSSEYSVSFDYNYGGLLPHTLKVKKGENATRIPDPSREGYDFIDWVTVRNGSDPFDFSKPILSNVTCYASWEAEDYEVIFDFNLVDCANFKVQVQYGQSVSAPTKGLPAYLEHNIEGWYLDNNIFSSKFNFDTIITGDLTLYAKWVLNKYKVSFDYNYDGKPANIEENIDFGFPVTAPSVEREGYDFSGWHEDRIVDSPFNFVNAITAPITLYAHWSIKTYTVSFDNNFNGVIHAIPTLYNNRVKAPDYDYRFDKEFLGWYTQSSGGTAFNTNDLVTKDVTYYAHWQDLTTSKLPRLDVDDMRRKDNSEVNIGDVQRDPYINVKVSLSDSEGEVILNSLKSEFKGRGNGSWYESAKKGYRFKFDSKKSLFGYEASKHWNIIPCTNFGDPTLTRNVIAYNLARDVFSNIEYTTPTRWVDVYMEGNYHGVYVLTEHVRVDAGRVDIDTEFGTMDTGYLIEYDAYGYYDEATDTDLKSGVHYFNVPKPSDWGYNYPFTVKSPDAEDYVNTSNEQTMRNHNTFIKNYTTNVYNAVYKKDYTTFASLADEASFVDMYILHEYMKNTDTGWSSFYMYKKPGGKLYAGPAWDFDASAGVHRENNPSASGIYVAGSCRWESDYTYSYLFGTLYNTPKFKEAVIRRWKEVSSSIHSFVERAFEATFLEARKAVMGKNFVRWNHMTQSNSEIYWINGMSSLKTWLNDRRNWLNNEWK